MMTPESDFFLIIRSIVKKVEFKNHSKKGETAIYLLSKKSLKKYIIMKSFRIVAVLFIVFALNTQLNARNNTNKVKKTAESVLAFANSMESFDADVLKAEIKELSIPERVKLVRLSIEDVKKAEASASATGSKSASAAASGKPTAGLYILAVIIPPIAVGLHTHWQITTLYNVLWTLLFWVPGIVHAIIVLER